MISRGLMELIFSASSIERWNDHPRTAQFTEIDKQAHKAMIAYFIARAEEDRGRAVDWNRLIANGAFSFLHRVLVTDIKPPVFHRLMQDRAQQRQLNDWVYAQLEPLLSPLDYPLCGQCRAYLGSVPDSLEDRILGAAHYVATRWEFGFIYYWSKPLYGIEKTREEIMGEIEKYRDLAAVGDILSSEHSAFNDLISLVGQLQFQKRWAQIQRLPPTSVLGHLLVVALLSWLISLEIGAGARRRRNDFYGGLFHDLPEVLTRDIISPVKRSVKGLDELVKKLERRGVEENLFPLLPPAWRDDVLYMVMDEFENRVRTNGRVRVIGRDLADAEGRDEMDPVDGRVIEVCDKLSAYIEARESIRIGVRPAALEEASMRLYDSFASRRVAGYEVKALFDSFK
ncbi:MULTISPECIES: HD domain-containing protein [unclassified Pyramidobacter]|uniref:HD domain-containing protein n=1 Tax=unclassified Pyramidobacter TaxID=2632171 RepID=UPI000EA3EEC9|nr:MULTISPECIES: HD domain-containing protein [unclassified Pyramidobacter]MCI7404055.1 HD domain-containing protein [Pyramidobacter sp.]MDY3211979.1 HD domain-containing protein [Pyramidobacter sp.]RKJ76460.1 HD domain-containing protein [Pyramidobacter sp. CG50-2]